jgi:transposase
MPKPLSNDLRKRIIDAKLRGDTEDKIASDKDVSKSTVTKLWSLYRTTESYSPRPNPNGRKPRLSEEQLEQIKKTIEERPDTTLKELIDEFCLAISIAALSQIVRFKLGFVYKKKTLYAVEQLREDVKMKREAWKSEQPNMDVKNLVFLDESSINTGMTRRYGRGQSSERVVDHTPDVRFERTTILSSVRANGDMVPCVFEGSLNGDIFTKYISEFLAPTLKEGDIVIMDNLSSHKVEGVIEPIRVAGATVLYLPPYSPDLNPIEMMWSKIKAYLRKAKARTKLLLEAAIVKALNSITMSDILAWFAENGYGIC